MTCAVHSNGGHILGIASMEAHCDKLVQTV
jgi:hypothetical protein